MGDEKLNKSKKIDWSIMDRATESMREFIPSAAPEYSALYRLKKEICKDICNNPDSKKVLKDESVFTKDLAKRIITKRVDHLTLKSILMCYDFIHKDHSEKRILNGFLSKFSDEDILKLTISSNKNTLDYTKETIPVDVAVSMYESMLVFKHGLSVNKASKIIAKEAALYLSGPAAIVA